MALITQKEFLENHRIQLDAKWHKDFPDGKFVIKILDSDRETQSHIGLIWGNARRMNMGCIGISINSHTEKIIYDRSSGYVSSLCTTHNYKSLESFIEGTKRYNIPKKLVDEFLIHVNKENCIKSYMEFYKTIYRNQMYGGSENA